MAASDIPSDNFYSRFIQFDSMEDEHSFLEKEKERSERAKQQAALQECLFVILERLYQRMYKEHDNGPAYTMVEALIDKHKPDPIPDNIERRLTAIRYELPYKSVNLGTEDSDKEIVVNKPKNLFDKVQILMKRKYLDKLKKDRGIRKGDVTQILSKIQNRNVRQLKEIFKEAKQYYPIDLIDDPIEFLVFEIDTAQLDNAFT